MSEDFWQQYSRNYRPTLLLGSLPGDLKHQVIGDLTADGWDVRIASPAASPTDGDQNAEAVALLGSARSIQPDLMIAAGSDNDPWAFNIIREVRSAPDLVDVGLVIVPSVSVPKELEVTPMSGPDAWLMRDVQPVDAIAYIRDTMREAIEDRLEWARRDWTTADRRHQSIKALRLKVELGETVDPVALADRLYGPGARVDIKHWSGLSPHGSGWRYGAEPRYGRPLTVQYQRVAVDDTELYEQQFILFSRSARLVIASTNAIAALAGGWPAIE